VPYRLELNSRARRLATFSLFYLSEGIPVGFTTIALAAHLRAQGSSLTAVGAVVAATYAPWAFKWAWAPLVDLVHIERLGHSRAWILLCQTAMVLTLAVLFGTGLSENVALLTSLVLVHNTFAATHDVAIDAMAVRVLPADEVGLANGLMFGAQYVGIGVGGSGALYVSDGWGFDASLAVVVAALLALLAGVTIPLQEPADTASVRHAGGKPLAAAILDRLTRFLRELRVAVLGGGLGSLLVAVFAVCPQGGMALGLATATSLQVDLGLSQATIASIALFTNVAGGAGAIAGGWLSDRVIGARLSVAMSYVTSSLTTLWLSFRFTGAGIGGLTAPALVGAVVLYTFAYGVGRGATAGVYMRLSSPAVAATQFTAYMALLNLASTYSSSWQGWYVDRFGYAATLRLDALLGCVALVVLPWLRPWRRDVQASATTESATVPSPGEVHVLPSGGG
jgi:PAT family beta-lactamase induction signal transducer AmpG